MEPIEKLAYGSLADLVSVKGLESPEAVAESESLPGVTLQSYTVKAGGDWIGKAEVYLFGVAADATGEVKAIPFGQAALDKKENVVLTKKVGEGQTVEFFGEGLALLLPPVKGFLVLRLLIADSDSKARDAAEIVKSTGEIVGSKEAIALLVAAGLPHAAAVGAVTGKALEAASIALAKSKDDLIEAFEGTFSAADLVAGGEVKVEGTNANAVFRFVA